MTFGLRIATPRIERVVDDHAAFQHGVIVVAMIGGQAQRNRQQAGRLRCQAGISGVGAAHDLREAIERRVLDRKDTDERVECTQVAVVRKRFCARNVIGDRSGLRPIVKTRSRATYRNSASGSMKRRTSQGQAMRSTFGRSRVIHLPGFGHFLRVGKA